MLSQISLLASAVIVIWGVSSTISMTPKTCFLLRSGTILVAVGALNYTLAPIYKIPPHWAVLTLVTGCILYIASRVSNIK